MREVLIEALAVLVFLVGGLLTLYYLRHRERV